MMQEMIKSGFLILLSFLPLPGVNNQVYYGPQIPPPMYDHIMTDMPVTMNAAMRMLADTLRMEAKTGHQMRRFGRMSSGRRSSSFKFVQTFLGSTPYDKHLSYPSFVQTKSLQMIRLKFDLDNEQVRDLMKRAPPILKPNPHTIGPDTLPHKPEPDTCPYAAQVTCDPSYVYRSYDGKCNNMQNPLWGSSHYPLARFLPPDYGDAIESPRVSVSGRELPSPRLVSSTIHWDVDLPHHAHTLMLMQFGQFIDHDISRTAITKLNMHPSGFSDDLEDVECGHDGCQVDGLENQACLPITVPRNDTVYGREPCLMFVRSQEAPNPKCKLGPREQLNQITSFLDCSLVYGSTLKESNDLRDFSDAGRGRLRMHPHPHGGKGLLPQDPEFKDCKGDNRTIICFKAGDGRANEFLGLTTQHLIWMREHNRVEQKFHSLNPHWDGEKLYQESRRLVTAMWQHMVYAEWLPILLGPKILERYGLGLTKGTYWNGYDETVNPSCGNSFATAAMRFGHSLIQGMLDTKNADYSLREKIPISTLFRRPHLMYMPPHNGADAVLRGSCSQNSQSMDSFITREVTQHLFADHPPNGLGEDLASLNMMRAREHGIPGYNAYREWCGLKRALTWEDLSAELPTPVIQRFQRLYSHVDDIDLFPAGISEFAYPGSVLGPTFSCILASQFRNLKYGDRFWFENAQHNPYPFTQAQIREIRKSSIAKVMCNNADTITHIQPRVLLHPRDKVLQNLRDQNKAPTLGKYAHLYENFPNDVMPCHAIADMELEAWRDQRPPPPPPPPPRPQRPQRPFPRKPRRPFIHPNEIPRRPQVDIGKGTDAQRNFILRVSGDGIKGNRIPAGLNIHIRRRPR